MKINFKSICVPLVTLVYFNLAAQPFDFDSLYRNDEDFKKSIQSRPDFEDIFSGDEVIRLTIESDFKNLMKRKFKDEYQPAIMRYYVNDTVVVARDITIKPRGNVRRQTCYFPPLKLNFPKKEAVMKQIKEFDKMKMVIDCKRGDTYEQYLLSEFYAYKLYNFITDYSFRVRLFEVTLHDTNDKFKSLTSYAYIIESIEQLAERLNAMPIETKNIRDQSTDLVTLANGYLFQYLIGNTDWSIPGRHNIEMIKSKDPALVKPYFIPYDFDYAGIVNTTYAVPDERLGIETVRERVYRGVCIEETYIKNAVGNYKKSREEIYNMYKLSLLDDRVRKSTITYLDEFYDLIETEGRVKIYILDQCRQ